MQMVFVLQVKALKSFFKMYMLLNYGKYLAVCLNVWYTGQKKNNNLENRINRVLWQGEQVQ